MAKHALGAFLGSLPPFVRAILAQAASLPVTLLVVMAVGISANLHIPLMGIAFLQGGIAALFTRGLGMMSWWLPIQLLFMPGVVAGLSLDIASYWYLLAFLLLLVVYWSVFHSQVPLYLSSRAAWQAMADLLPSQPGLRLIDLGSGLGGLLGFLARIRPDGRFVGIETAPLPFALGWLRCALKGCDMRFGSFWKHDLGDYDVVYAYLSPVPMADLWRKVKAEMKPHSLFVSNTFAVPGVVASNTVEVDDFHASTLYIYRL